MAAWLGAAVVAVSVVFDPWGLAPFGPIKWAAFTALALAGTAAVLSGQAVSFHGPSLAGWGAFLAWGAVVSLFAVDPFHTWFGTPQRRLGWVAWVLFAALYLVGQGVGADARRPLLVAGVVALAVTGGYAVVEMAGIDPVALDVTSGRAVGPFGSAAYLGAATVLLVPVAVGFGAGEAGWRRVVAWLVAALGVAAMIASQTRAAWVGALVAVAIAAPAWVPAIRRRRWTAPAVIAAVVVLVALTPVGSRLGDALDLDDGGARGRWDEWRIGAAAFAAHPVVGVGFEGYRVVFPDHVDADYARRHGRAVAPDRAHNGLLDTGITTGVPGLVAAAAAAVFLIGRALRATRSGEAWLAGIGAGVAGYLAQQQFLFPISELDGTWWLFAGVLVSATGAGHRRRVRVPLWVVPLVLCGAALAWGSLDVIADHRAAGAVETCCPAGSGGPLALADEAVSLRPDSIRYGVIAASVAASDADGPGLRRAVDRIRGALDVSPRDPLLLAAEAGYLLDVARAEQDADVLADAQRRWEALVASDPYHAEYRLHLGVALAIAGDQAAAEAAWLAAVDLAPTDGRAAGLLVDLYRSQGRSEDAAAMTAILDQAGSGREDGD